MNIKQDIKNVKVDRNFRLVTYEDEETGQKEVMTALRYRFSKIKTIDRTEWLKKHKLEKTTLTKLLSKNARVNGSKIRDLEGNTARIIKQLKKDGVWVGSLPWEDKEEVKDVC